MQTSARQFVDVASGFRRISGRVRAKLDAPRFIQRSKLLNAFIDSRAAE